jgi:hypothetical protein
MKTIKEHLLHLDRIAAANNDDFRYGFSVVLLKGEPHFAFEAREIADDHIIIYSGGLTPESAVHCAMKGIKKSCDDWGYKYVD